MVKCHKSYISSNKILVDNVELILGDILSQFLNANVIAGTMTIPMDNIKDDIKENGRKRGYWYALDECANEGVYWRQLDASRNSIQMVGQANFSHKELQHKSCNNIQDMLMTQKGINWNDLPTYQKRGSCCVRNKIIIKPDDVMETAQLKDTSKSENEWIIDTEIPIFKGEGREYIDRLVFVGEE